MIENMQGLIQHRMVALGYNADFESGICAGLARMWVQAATLNEEQKFNNRLKLICSSAFVDQAKQLKAKIANLEGEISVKKQAIRMPVDDLRKRIHANPNQLELTIQLQDELIIRDKREQEIESEYFTHEERELIDALVFLDGVAAFQNPQSLPIQGLLQTEITDVSPIVNSIALEGFGGVSTIFKDTLYLTIDEVTKYFTDLTEILKQLKNEHNKRFIFTMVAKNHMIGLIYDCDTESWHVCNITQLLYSDEKSISGHLTNYMGNVVNGLQKNIRLNRIGKYISLTFGHKQNDMAARFHLIGISTNPDNPHITSTLITFKKQHLPTYEMAGRSTVIYMAVRENDIDTLDKYKNIATPLADHLLKSSLIHLASEQNNVALIDYLVARGAKINLQDELNQTPQFCVKNGSVKACLHLIKLGGNVLDVDKLGDTPLHYIGLFKNPEDMEEIISIAKDVNLKNKSGQTPVFNAAQHGNVLALELLHKHGADITVEGNERRPIDIAAENGNISFVEAMMRLGADPNPTTNFGAVHAAAASNQAKVIDYLSSINVDLDCASLLSHIKPFQSAIEHGALYALVALHQHGVDIQQLSHDRHSPLSVAIEFQQWNIVMFYLLINADVTKVNRDIINKHRDDIVNAFKTYVHQQDKSEQPKLVRAVVNGENMLGKLLNAFVSSFGLSYSSYKDKNGKMITHSIAKIIEEFPEAMSHDMGIEGNKLR